MTKPTHAPVGNDKDTPNENKTEKGSREFRNLWNKLKSLKCSQSSIYFIITTFLLAVVVIVQECQISSLKQEMADFRSDFSDSEEKLRLIKKRSSGEVEDDMIVSSGIQAANLQGTLPFQHIQKQGRIGPWSVLSSEVSFLKLKEKDTEIEITQNGLYYVYAQIYYFTSQPHNSFQILSYNGTEPRHKHKNLAMCASQGRNTMGETSCFTGFAATFQAGQRLYLNQIEQNRIIHFSDGSSYFGLVLLKRNTIMKKRT